MIKRVILICFSILIILGVTCSSYAGVSFGEAPEEIRTYERYRYGNPPPIPESAIVTQVNSNLQMYKIGEDIGFKVTAKARDRSRDTTGYSANYFSMVGSMIFSFKDGTEIEA